jgi:hypothetical protein
MGWSCSARANHRLDALTQFCVAQTGSQNRFEHKNASYFFEVSRREHADGAITGTIHRFVTESMQVKSGTLRIEGNGKITRAPKILKNVPALILSVDGHECLWRQTTPPTEEDLRAFIKGEYIKQYLPGGINAHVSKTLGYVPYPNIASVTDLDTGKVVALWGAAMFEVW